MSNLKIYEKPKLAVLRDEKKLAMYSNEEKLIIAQKIVFDLLSVIGVSSKGNEEHHVSLIKYLMENEYEFTPNEIVEAYNLAMRGKFKYTLFQQLNTLQYNTVMNHYREYRNSKLKIYNLEQAKLKNEMAIKELTEEQKEELIIKGVEDQFYLCQQKQDIQASRYWISKYFIQKQLLSKNEIDAIWKISDEKASAKRKAMRLSHGKMPESDYLLMKKGIAKEMAIRKVYSRFSNWEQLKEKL